MAEQKNYDGEVVMTYLEKARIIIRVDESCGKLGNVETYHGGKN